MSRLILAGVAALALSTAASAAVQAPTIAAAVADKGRPEADTKRDADRKPAEMLAFAGVKPGDKVLELIPSSGYFSRIFSKAVGPGGKVYAAYTVRANATAAPPIEGIAADPAYGNIRPLKISAFTELAAPEPVDIVWTSQNYHDLHNGTGSATVPQVNAQVFKALKPGGVYIVLDHAAASGSAVDPDDKLHRIDPAIVRREVEAAGFKFEGASKALANPADDHTKPVFDPSIRGHTDQFIYKFRKPK